MTHWNLYQFFDLPSLNVTEPSTKEIAAGANNYSPLLELSESRQSVFFKNQDEFLNSQ
jgi:hypothetical protein